MNDLIVKGVDLMGDTVMAAQDKYGNIWAGVSYFCRGLGMDKKQKDNQVERVQQDDVLKRGAEKFPAGVFDDNNETVALRIDYIPIWLTKISITPKMKRENPELAEKLLNYQLQAKDILAAAFLPKQDAAPLTLQKQVQVIAQGTSELYERVGAAEERITVLEDTMTIDYGQQRVLGETVNKTVITVLGGQSAPAYKDIGRKVFAECNHDLKAYFKVNARANVPKKRFDEAVEYARNWKPCTNTAMLIAEYNAQQTLNLEGGASRC